VPFNKSGNKAASWGNECPLPATVASHANKAVALQMQKKQLNQHYPQEMMDLFFRNQIF
jgi:hypothetical protein